MPKDKLGKRPGDLSICERCNGVIVTRFVADGALLWSHHTESIDADHHAVRVVL